MTKSEAIKAAYGEYYIKENIDENGWTNNPPEGMLKSIPCEVNEIHIVFGITETWCRPMSISSIENNNGWTRIESEEDIPVSGIFGKTCFLGGGKYIEGNIRFRSYEELKWGFKERFITHYKKMESDQPPIF